MKKLKLLKITVLVVCISALAVVFSSTFKDEITISAPSSENTPASTVVSPITSVKKTDEMRALWVPFMSLDMSNTDKSFDSFKEKFDTVIKNTISCGLNTLIVHVRPFCDALYRSSIFPQSHILSTEQGKDCGYDALEYMVLASHKAGLKIHAWINPLRVKSKGASFDLSSDNPAKKWENTDYVLSYDEGLYLNPAHKEVRKLIIDGVREIVRNYDVDGIQFDDYFYPTTESSFDEKSYDAYRDSISEDEIALTLSSWRTSNINMLVSGVYSAIHSISDKVVFGISPQGNIDNDISICADVINWCSTKGYIDYICPQIYVSLDHAILPFEETAKKWQKLVTNKEIKLYLGLALYKAGSDADDGTWQGRDDIINTQIKLSRKLKCDGFMLYSYDYLISEQTETEVQNVISILK